MPQRDVGRSAEPWCTCEPAVVVPLFTPHRDTPPVHESATHLPPAPRAAAFQTGKVFWSTYVLLSLYVWLVIHRLRDVRHADVKFFRQRFYNQFQQDVEFRVYAAGVQVRRRWCLR